MKQQLTFKGNKIYDLGIKEGKAQALAEIEELKKQRNNLIGDNLALRLKIAKLQEQKDDGKL